MQVRKHAIFGRTGAAGSSSGSSLRHKSAPAMRSTQHDPPEHALATTPSISKRVEEGHSALHPSRATRVLGICI